MRFQPFIAAIVGSALAAAASAHDFWIDPSALSAKVEEALTVGLRVGHREDPEVFRRNPERFERFAVIDSQGERDVVGQDGADPAGAMRTREAGASVIVYRGRRQAITLEAEKFESYLREEGLEAIIQKRRERGESKNPGREMFSRCAKAIVMVGDSSAGFDRRADLRLELTPQDDPTAVKAGGELHVRLTFEGKPVEGAQIRATGPSMKPSASKSNRDGLATVRIDQAGEWMFTAVHMIEAEASIASEADWESLWASLVVGVGRAEATQPAMIKPSK
jgi:uncharacterized GH25 family protein